MSTIATIVITLLSTALLVTLGINLATAEKRLLYRPRRLYTSRDADFRRALGVLLGPPLVAGNEVTTLINGPEIFPAMLEAIHAAEVSITFETFVFRDDIGKLFCQALRSAARRGVHVHVLLDWLGSRAMPSAMLSTMREAGADVQLYHAPSWFHLGRLNNRTHRKIMIIDGKIGYTGGVGFGHEWANNREHPKDWRESHYRVLGPVVAQMQAVFIDNWIKATGRVLHGPEYFPTHLPVAGDMDAQMFGSSPVGGSESMHLMVLLALTAAHTSIDIENPYFVPDRLTVDALIEARRRGVRVRIVVPGRYIDARIGRWAAQGLYGILLRAGIEIFEYQPTMIHCKVLVIDSVWTSVGSANFDDRSFRLNDEANLNVFSPRLATEQIRQIDADIAQSRRMVLKRWARRSASRRLYENLALLLRSQL
ncbi:MAG TPA: phospholipase D-like domain-containing protein [Steroidobacteraceae bacterium]|jgi:cardiolipin synthase|nr:phospholipase D-like domain-containing protein [Steroidobacteraceae bacterium]